MKKIFITCLVLSLTTLLACNNPGNQTATPFQLKELNLEQFHAVVSKPGKLVLVDFYADWCQPCRMLKPHIEAIGEEMKDRLEVVTINVDHNKALADELDIDGIPLLHIYKDQKLIWTGVGYRDKAQLESEINQLQF